MCDKKKIELKIEILNTPKDCEVFFNGEKTNSKKKENKDNSKSMNMND